MYLPQSTINNQQLTINRRPWRRGFSLIELLVVISIIGLLTAIGTASLSNAQQKGRDARRKADLKTIQQALELYFQANGKYPATSSGSIQCNIPGDTSTKTWGTGVFICGTNTFMQQLPSDPTNQSTNGYYYNSNNAATPPNITYVISANLENDNDQERILAAPPCTPQDSPSRDYCVTNP